MHADWNHACDAPQQPHTWFDNAALMSHSHPPRNGALAGGASASCLVGTTQVGGWHVHMHVPAAEVHAWVPLWAHFFRKLREGRVRREGSLM